jgi:hypothetical protein
MLKIMPKSNTKDEKSESNQRVDINIQNQVQSFNSTISSILVPIHKLDNQKIKSILSRYQYVFEGNFIVWMTSAYLFSQSLEGKQNSFENIWVEIVQNHPGLLHEFTKVAKTEINTEDLDIIIGKIRTEIAKKQAVYSLTLMALLENSSSIFIPYLEEIAKNIGVTKLVYTQIHGIADINHADQFVHSLIAERDYVSDPIFNTQFKMAMDDTRKLLSLIFKV